MARHDKVGQLLEAVNGLLGDRVGEGDLAQRFYRQQLSDTRISEFGAVEPGFFEDGELGI